MQVLRSWPLCRGGDGTGAEGSGSEVAQPGPSPHCPALGTSHSPGLWAAGAGAGAGGSGENRSQQERSTEASGSGEHQSHQSGECWSRSEWGAPELVGGGSTGAGQRGEHWNTWEGGAVELVGVGSIGPVSMGSIRARGGGEHWGWLGLWCGRNSAPAAEAPKADRRPLPQSGSPPGFPRGTGKAALSTCQAQNWTLRRRSALSPGPECGAGATLTSRRERGPRGGVPRRQGAGCRSEPGPPTPRAAFPFGRGGLQGAEETSCSHLPALVFLLTHLYGAPPGLRE